MYSLWYVFKYSTQILSMSLEPGSVVFRTFAPLDLLPSCFWFYYKSMELLSAHNAVKLLIFLWEEFIRTHICILLTPVLCFWFCGWEQILFTTNVLFLYYFVVKVLEECAVNNIQFLSGFSYAMAAYDLRLMLCLRFKNFWDLYAYVLCKQNNCFIVDQVFLLKWIIQRSFLRFI